MHSYYYSTKRASRDETILNSAVAKYRDSSVASGQQIHNFRCRKGAMVSLEFPLCIFYLAAFV